MRNITFSEYFTVNNLSICSLKSFLHFFCWPPSQPHGKNKNTWKCKSPMPSINSNSPKNSTGSTRSSTTTTTKQQPTGNKDTMLSITTSNLMLGPSFCTSAGSIPATASPIPGNGLSLWRRDGWVSSLSLSTDTTDNPCLSATTPINLKICSGSTQNKPSKIWPTSQNR